MTFHFTRLVTLLALIGFLTGCGQSNTAPLEPTLPDGLSVQSLANATDGKTDSLTRRFGVDKGEYKLGTDMKGEVNAAKLQMYRVQLTEGDTVVANIEASYWGLAVVYKKDGKHWRYQTHTYIRPNENRFSASFKEFRAKSSGEYAFSFVTFWTRKPWSYKFRIDCLSGSCLSTTHCVTWQGANYMGNPINRIYAQNVSDYEAGKKLLTDFGRYVNEQITKGRCSSDGMCMAVYQPICGYIDGEIKTASNTCAFRFQVAGATQDDGQSVGKFTTGACPTNTPCSEAKKCAGGEKCFSQDVTCVRAPCEPIQTCVLKNYFSTEKDGKVRWYDSTNISATADEKTIVVSGSGHSDPIPMAVDDESTQTHRVEFDRALLEKIELNRTYTLSGTASWNAPGGRGFISPEMVTFKPNANHTAVVSHLFFYRSCFCYGVGIGSQDYNGTIRFDTITKDEISGSILVTLRGHVPMGGDQIQTIRITLHFSQKF